MNDEICVAEASDEETLRRMMVENQTVICVPYGCVSVTWYWGAYVCHRCFRRWSDTLSAATAPEEVYT